MDHVCPVCQRELTKEHMIEYIDYHCYPPPSNHHYSKRIKGDKLAVVKARLNPDKDKIFFKIDFTNNYLEVWTKPEAKDSRIRVNTTFTPDFSDLKVLFEKLRTYLLFS